MNKLEVKLRRMLKYYKERLKVRQTINDHAEALRCESIISALESLVIYADVLNRESKDAQ